MNHFSYRLRITALASAIFCLAPSAWGQEKPTAAVKHEMSITIAPFYLINPIVEGSFEKRMTNKIGLAAIGGIGSTDGIFTFNLGGIWKYYLIGSFEHAFQTGVELNYAHASSGNVNGSNISASAGGLEIGPIIGYKYIADYGLTLDLSVGAGFALISARADDNTTSQGASLSYSALTLILNLNAGWSF